MRGPGTTYNHLRKHTLAAAVGALLIAAGVLWSGTLSSNAAGETLGVDTDTTGNDAATVGAREPCRQVSVNETFSVDVFITDVSNIQQFDIRFTYNSSLIAVTNVDPGFMVTGFGDPPVEESPGTYFVGRGATTSKSGDGVLARFTLQAVGPGFSPASLRTDRPYRPNLSGPNGPIGDVDNDIAHDFDGPILNAQIAIGQSCSGAPTSSPTPVTTPSPSPTSSPSPTPTGTIGGTTPTPSPTFTPVPGSIPWGDINCMQGVTIDDAVDVAKLKTGLSVSPIGAPCPEVGDQVFGAPIAVNWGDFDCSQQFDLGDAIHIIRYLIGLTGGIGGCPLIATNYVSSP